MANSERPTALGVLRLGDRVDRDDLLIEVERLRKDREYHLRTMDAQEDTIERLWKTNAELLVELRKDPDVYGWIIDWLEEG